MRFDRYDKTVVIPAKYVNGKFQYFYGGYLPEFQDGTIIDLVVPEYAIKDTDFLKVLNTGHSEVLLPKGETIYAAVSSRQIPERLRNLSLSIKSLIQGSVSTVIASLFPDSLFVEILLDEPLYLELRGTKHGRLKPVKCSIPSLKKEARSLNHAYYLISEIFEPDRISHAGSVFQKMMYIDSRTHCSTLDDLRNDLEARYEHILRLPSG